MAGRCESGRAAFLGEFDSLADDRFHAVDGAFHEFAKLLAFADNVLMIFHKDSADRFGTPDVALPGRSTNMSPNARSQAIVLFIVAPIGVLGLLAQIESGNIPLAIMFAVVTPAGCHWLRQCFGRS